VTSLADWIRGQSVFPLLAVGSGGSFTAASFAAYLHQLATGQIAKAVTPFEVVTTHLNLRETNILILTAGGKNPDVLGAFTKLTEREPRSITVICTRGKSPLAKLASEHSKCHVFEFDLPTGKDGFLATNSLLATIVLLTRGYEFAGLLSPPLPGSMWDLMAAGTRSEAFRAELAERAAPLWGRRSLILLNTLATQPAALDLESRFSEAAIANTQVVDYRNFAHGRHYWLARHRDTTAIVAYVTDEVASLAEQTLRLIPERIPVLRVNLLGEGVETAIVAIVYSLHLAQLAGHALGVDPGKPAVPEFGRRLYRLQAFRSPSKQGATVPSAEAAAIERKSRKTLRSLELRNELTRWRSAYRDYVSTLLGIHFAAVAFDYDGTLCESSERSEGPRREVMEHLGRLFGADVLIGVATGRGKSVREQLRARIDCSRWSSVPVAYYNGSEVGLLNDDGCPRPEKEPAPPLDTVKELLLAHPLILENCLVDTNRNQLTVSPRTEAIGITEIWQLVAVLAEQRGAGSVRVLRSDHSVDVLRSGSSKTAIFGALRSLIGGVGADSILCIGDRGCWPGNDCDLLGQPYSLSVDETSPDLGACWNLASPGLSNTKALVEYLSLLDCRSGRAAFSAKRFAEAYK
jgi:fructoselysine-6-P-deglycase FrlB-like protein/hydroxymethylpyrimidine pyrophosphatase-like HAD family hydrolase